MRKKVLIVLLYMFSSSSYSEDVSRDYRETGLTLLYDLKSCKKNGETYSCGSATGYIKGVIETLDGVYVCPQQKLNNGQIFDTVEFFLEKNPKNQEKLRLNAVT